MKEIDVTLKGVTHAFKNGKYGEDLLYVTMAVSTCVMNNENGAKRDFPIPPLVTVCISPYRLVVPIDEKYRLTRNGSEVEFHVTGTVNNPKVTLVKVDERKDCPLADFLKKTLELEAE